MMHVTCLPTDRPQLRAGDNHTAFCARQGHGGEQERLGPCPRGGPVLVVGRCEKLVSRAWRREGCCRHGGAGTATLARAARGRVPPKLKLREEEEEGTGRRSAEPVPGGGAANAKWGRRRGSRWTKNYPKSHLLTNPLLFSTETAKVSVSVHCTPPSPLLRVSSSPLRVVGNLTCV